VLNVLKKHGEKLIVNQGKGNSLWHIFSSTNKFIVVAKKVVIEQPKNKPNYGQISR
jgi:hypothetical protein